MLKPHGPCGVARIVVVRVGLNGTGEECIPVPSSSGLEVPFFRYRPVDRNLANEVKLT